MDTKDTKKPFYKKWWFWALAVLVLFIIAGASNGNNTTQNTESQTQQSPQTNTTPSAETKEEVVKVTAVDLYAAYDANQIAADEKYKGKMLEITGLVGSIGKDILDTPYVQLEASNPYLGVQCMLSKDEATKASSLKKGQRVTLQGRGDGKAINPVVRGCKVL